MQRILLPGEPLEKPFQDRTKDGNDAEGVTVLPTARTPRAKSLDPDKALIPSPPRGMLDSETLMGQIAWVKLHLHLEETNEKFWVQALGEVCGLSPDQVRGEGRVEVYIPYFKNTVIISMDYLEDYVNDKKAPLDPERVQGLVRGVPADAEALGLGVKAYLIPEEFRRRLEAWNGRNPQDGKKINGALVERVSGSLGLFVRRHAGGFVKGENWPRWPAEESLGIDKQVRRRRSRSRSHSLSRAIREFDQEKRGEEPQPARVHDSESVPQLCMHLQGGLREWAIHGGSDRHYEDCVRDRGRRANPEVEGSCQGHQAERCGGQEHMHDAPQASCNAQSRTPCYSPKSKAGGSSEGE